MWNVHIEYVDFEITLKRKEEVGKRELLERNNCMWYTDWLKKDTGTVAGFLKMRMGESISINLGSHWGKSHFYTRSNHGITETLTQKDVYKTS